MTNQEIARHLREIADALERTGANDHRVAAYRRGADAIETHDVEVASEVESGGATALTEIRGIGESLSRLIEELVSSGDTQLHRRLKESLSPEEVFADLPGIGAELARRIADTLGVSTLEELEEAAHDGRLGEIDGVGEQTAAAVRDVLQARLGRVRGGVSGDAQSRGDTKTDEEAKPSRDLLLRVDEAYRRKAEAGELRTIAPKRFNPENKAWLPIMETEREGYSFTVLYSNTAKAHREGKTNDWVVIYFERDGKKGQATVITGRSGERVIPSYR